MIPLGAGDVLAAAASVANKLTFVCGYMDVATGAFDVQAGSSGGYLPAAAAAQLTAGASGALVRAIGIVNTDTVNRTVTIYVGGTTAAATYFGTITLPPNYTLVHDDTGWAVLTDQGQRLGVGATGAAGTGVTDGDKGDITVSSSGTVWTIDNSAVTLAKIANIANNRVLGNVSGGAAAPAELTGAQVAALISAPTVNVYSAGATWTKPAGARFVLVECHGGGGGSGGTAATAAGSRAASGAGGGGGYARKMFAASALAATETVVVGAAGAAGASGNNAGGAGGDSYFGAVGYRVTGAGGGGGDGGAAQTNANTAAGGLGGTASGGDVNASGEPGDSGRILAGPATLPIANGGGAFWGGGGLCGAGASGTAGQGVGGGGGGTTGNASDGARAGAAGSAGLVVVTTYY